MVICEICKKELNSLKALSAHISIHKICIKDYYDKFLKKSENICLCGKETKFKSISEGYRQFCSPKCASIFTRTESKKIWFNKYGVEHPSKNKNIKEKKKKTCILRYGVENPSQIDSVKDKKKKTCLINYGVEYPTQSINIMKKIKKTCIDNDIYVNSQKIKKKTCLQKYGVDHCSKLEYIKQKTINTNLSKYGVKYVFSNKSIRDRIKKTNLKKYGFENPSKNKLIKNKKKYKILSKMITKLKNMLKVLDLILLDNYYDNSRSFFKVLCLKCKTEFLTSYFNIYQGCGRCPNCYPKYKSIAEQEILNFIKKLGFSVVKNNRQLIKPLELDVYIPDKKIAIEYNGLYWHSDVFNKDKNYHLNKLNKCQEKGIKLIQIFEDEWIKHPNIVKNRLKQILNVSNSIRIHARKCIIREISPKIKNEFLEKYHLQGKDNSKIKLGAFYNEELVAVMTFSKGNIAKGSKSKEGIWELNRFCSNYNYHIPGIASKLFTYFKRNYKYKQIFSYADRRWSVGNVYYKLGFELEKETIPNYWYSKGLKRIHRFNLRKRPNEPKDITESVLRMQEGYSKIWDCGHLKFILNFTDKDSY